MTRRLSRRALLRGAGGAFLLTPFLESLGAGRALAQATVPTRLLVYLSGEGTLLQRWRPPTLSGDQLQLSELLQPLAAFQDRLVVISGLENKLPRYHNSNGHNAPGHTLLTAGLVETSADGADQLRPEGARATVEAGSRCVSPSFDHALAARLGAAAPLNLAIGNSDPGENRMFYRVKAPGATGPAAEAPLANDPVAVFRARLAGLGGGSTITTAEKLLSQRQSVLQAVRGSLRALTTRVSAADRERLLAHEARIQDLEARLNYVPPTDCGGLTQTLPPGVPNQTPAYRSSWPNEDGYARAMIDVAVQALACGASRIVTLQHTLYDGPSFDFLPEGPMSGWHAMVHGDQGGPPNDNRQLIAGFRWYASSFTYLLERMAAIQEPNGQSLLDNTLVLWISEFGNGGTHSTTDLPVVLAGRLQGALNTNRHLVRTGYATGDLYSSLFAKFGVDPTGFGYTGDSDLNRGGVPGL